MNKAESRSVPAVVADEYASSFDLYGKDVCGFIRRGRKRRTGADAEACAVTRADDYITFDRVATGKHGTVVGAYVFDGVERAIDVEHGNDCAVEFNSFVVARLDGLGFGDKNPVTHYGRGLAGEQYKPVIAGSSLQFHSFAVSQ